MASIASVTLPHAGLRFCRLGGLKGLELGCFIISGQPRDGRVSLVPQTLKLFSGVAIDDWRL